MPRKLPLKRKLAIYAAAFFFSVGGCYQDKKSLENGKKPVDTG